MNKDDRRELQEGYNKAKKMYLDKFFFQGKKIAISYAKHLLEKR